VKPGDLTLVRYKNAFSSTTGRREVKRKKVKRDGGLEFRN
jgi:hypothetical protein